MFTLMQRDTTIEQLFDDIQFIMWINGPNSSGTNILRDKYALPSELTSQYI